MNWQSAKVIPMDLVRRVRFSIFAHVEHVKRRLSSSEFAMLHLLECREAHIKVTYQTKDFSHTMRVPIEVLEDMVTACIEADKREVKALS